MLIDYFLTLSIQRVNFCFKLPNHVKVFTTMEDFRSLYSWEFQPFHKLILNIKYVNKPCGTRYKMLYSFYIDDLRYGIHKVPRL